MLLRLLSLACSLHSDHWTPYASSSEAAWRAQDGDSATPASLQAFIISSFLLAAFAGPGQRARHDGCSCGSAALPAANHCRRDGAYWCHCLSDDACPNCGLIASSHHRLADAAWEGIAKIKGRRRQVRTMSQYVSLASEDYAQGQKRISATFREGDDGIVGKGD